MDRRKVKNIALILTGFIIGVVFAYGFMWYQVYRKFDTVWTCQVFTGALTIDQAKHCEQYKAKKADGSLIYY